MQVKKQQFELDMEQQTGSKQEKEYVKAVYCHPAYLKGKKKALCKLCNNIFHLKTGLSLSIIYLAHGNAFFRLCVSMLMIIIVSNLAWESISQDFP